MPHHAPSMRRYKSQLAETLTIRHPRYSVPVFFRTVFGLCFLSVVFCKRARSTSAKSAQHCSAPATSADSWIITRNLMRSFGIPTRCSHARWTSMTPGSLLMKVTLSFRRYGLLLEPSAQ